jgi:hypothetical protein
MMTQRHLLKTTRAVADAVRIAPGNVGENVDAPVPLHRAGGGLFDRLIGPDVGRNRTGLPTGPPNTFRRGFDRVGVDINEHHTRALGGIVPGTDPSDARGGSGYDGDFVFKSHVCSGLIRLLPLVVPIH